MKKIATVLLFFGVVVLHAQILKGEVFLKDHSILYLNQVYVTNITTMKTVLTDYAGKFGIEAKLGDKIRFTSIVTERKDIMVTKELLENSNNFIELKLDYYDIEEVRILSFRPSGNLRKDVLSLHKKDKVQEVYKMIGLPRPNIRSTPQNLPVASLANGGLSISLESVFDILSGERKKKERYVEYEKMNSITQNIQNYLGDEYFTSQKIPKEFIPNFLQFVYTSEKGIIQNLIQANNYEGVKYYLEKYYPIYQKRLKNSHLMNLIQ
ncbi:MAG: hypothetical protein JSS94_11130 [Bacteroidetes bacterium]|nr:hypothetical protein [Bacteroidota bacterium]